MKKVSVIDLGSNSVRMTVAAVENGSYSVVRNSSVYVRLSEGLTDDSNTLKPEPVLRTVNALKRFSDESGALKVDEIYVIATEAVRRADNNEWFCELVKGFTGLEITVLSGEEEALYDCVSISNETGLSDFTVIDTGGGSTEIALFKDGYLKRFVSMPWGAVTLTSMFSRSESMSLHEFGRAAEYVADGISSIGWLSECTGLPVVGVGGSLRTFKKLSDNDSLAVYLGRVVKMSLSERVESGISSDRVDILPAGLLPAHMLMLALNTNDIIVSDGNIRDGFLLTIVLNS